MWKHLKGSSLLQQCPICAAEANTRNFDKPPWLKGATCSLPERNPARSPGRFLIQNQNPSWGGKHHRETCHEWLFPGRQTDRPKGPQLGKQRSQSYHYVRRKAATRVADWLADGPSLAQAAFTVGPRRTGWGIKAAKPQHIQRRSKVTSKLITKYLI